VRRLDRLHNRDRCWRSPRDPEVRSQLAMTWGTETPFIVPMIGAPTALSDSVDKVVALAISTSAADLVVIVAASAGRGTARSTN